MNQIEVFVEKNCKACEEVVAILQESVHNNSVDVKVFEREHHQELFHRRRVVICPATFFNKKLAFYGTFTQSALNEILRQTLS
jgi:predicted thioredoxin/glutaredoxin